MCQNQPGRLLTLRVTRPCDRMGVTHLTSSGGGFWRTREAADLPSSAPGAIWMPALGHRIGLLKPAGTNQGKGAPVRVLLSPIHGVHAARGMCGGVVDGRLIMNAKKALVFCLAFMLLWPGRVAAQEGASGEPATGATPTAPPLNLNLR